MNFAFVTANEGGDRVDPLFFTHIAQAKDAAVTGGLSRRLPVPRCRNPGRAGRSRMSRAGPAGCRPLSASTAAHAHAQQPGQPWVFRQYSRTGRVPGTGDDVSLNGFAGSPAASAGWHARRAQHRPRGHEPRGGGALPPRRVPRSPPGYLRTENGG